MVFLLSTPIYGLMNMETMHISQLHLALLLLDAAFGSKLYVLNYYVIGCTRIDAETCAR